MRALRTTIGLLLLVACARQSQAADASDFKPFTSREGRFTISFPGKPESKTSTIKSKTGDMEMHVFQVGRPPDKESFTLTYNDLSPEAIKGDPDKVLDVVRDGGVDLTHGKVKRETKIAKSDKNPLTRDLEIEIQGVTTYSRLVLAGNRLYVIMAYPDGTQGSPERAKLFLDSFKLAKDEAAGRAR
jgi:hypothetical protein